MPDAIQDAIYYDDVVGEPCRCTDLHDSEDGPKVVLSYDSHDTSVTVPLDVFKVTSGIEVLKLPDTL